MAAMVRGGVDVVEVGLPYSDPLMDGPTIQAAVEAALRRGTTHRRRARHGARRSRRPAPPALVMTYWNPIERYGARRFADATGGGRRRRRHHPRPDPGRGRRRAVGLARRHRRDRARPGLPRRAVLDRRAAALAPPSTAAASSTRRRLMGVTGARGVGRRRRRGAGRAGSARSPTCRCASGSASPPATRRPRSRPSPTASSSARRSCARCSTRPTPDDGLRAVEALAAELADGVRRGAAVTGADAPRWSRRAGALRWPACSPAARAASRTGAADVRVNGEHRLAGTAVTTGYPLPDQTFTDTAGEPSSRPRTPPTAVTLVFFGYTHCPDICNVVLANIASALRGSTAAVRDRRPDALRHHRPGPRHAGRSSATTSTGSTRRSTGLVAPVGTVEQAARQLHVELRAAGRLATAAATRSTTAPTRPASSTARRPVVWSDTTPVADLRADLAPARAASLSSVMDLASFPSPVRRGLAPRTGPAAGLRPVHHRRDLRSRSGWASGAGWPAAAGPGDVTEIATWMVPVRHRRRPDLPRDHLAAGLLRRRAATRSRRSTSGRAASASGAPSRSAGWAPGSAAAAGASRCRPSPTRWRPASSSPRPSAGWATTSTRSSTAGRPTCRGRVEIDRGAPAGRPRSTWRRTTRPSSTSCCGTSASPRW